MIKKYIKYALLAHAEVVSLSSKMIKEASEEFIKKNVDADYEKSLSEVFDGIEQKVRDLSPHIDKIKDNVIDFRKKFKAN